jgi:hypothetical protein
MRKSYLARVAGRFPGGAPVLVDVPLAWEPRTNHVYAVPEGQQEGQGGREEAPGGSGGPAAQRAAAGAAAAAPPPGSQLQAKPSSTQFELLHVAPDGLTSVVSCRPLTGRTHQIRVHLQFLGHPIANDRQYGGQQYGSAPSSALAAAPRLRPTSAGKQCRRLAGVGQAALRPACSAGSPCGTGARASHPLEHHARCGPGSERVGWLLQEGNTAWSCLPGCSGVGSCPRTIASSPRTIASSSSSSSSRAAAQQKQGSGKEAGVSAAPPPSPALAAAAEQTAPQQQLAQVQQLAALAALLDPACSCRQQTSSQSGSGPRTAAPQRAASALGQQQRSRLGLCRSSSSSSSSSSGQGCWCLMPCGIRCASTAPSWRPPTILWSWSLCGCTATPTAAESGASHALRQTGQRRSTCPRHWASWMAGTVAACLGSRFQFAADGSTGGWCGLHDIHAVLRSDGTELATQIKGVHHVAMHVATSQRLALRSQVFQAKASAVNHQDSPQKETPLQLKSRCSTKDSALSRLTGTCAWSASP